MDIEVNLSQTTWIKYEVYDIILLFLDLNLFRYSILEAKLNNVNTFLIVVKITFRYP